MIDWDRVRILQDEVGAEDFDEIVTMFMEEVETAIKDLRTAADLTALGESLHFLKGSALSLGFASFSEICQHCEKSASQGQAEQIDIAKVSQTFIESKDVFFQGLSEFKAA